MYKNWIPTFPMVATSALLMGCCVFFATSAVAASCGDRTLQGNYGFHAEGTLSPAPNITLTFRAVGMTHFDGDGHVSWVEHTVIGGVSVAPGFTPASGTYTVNSDCTGTAVINTPDSPVPLHLSFIVVNDGKDVHSVLATDAVSTEFTKVDD